MSAASERVWAIPEGDLIQLLRRAHRGEDVDFLMTEFRARDLDYVEPDDPHYVTGYGGPGGGLMPGDGPSPE